MLRGFFMQTSKKLAVELFRSVFQDPWHGASLKEVIESCSVKKVFQKPITNAHSIIELVLHLNSWTEEILSRMEDNLPSEPINGDWPISKDETEEYWDEVKLNLYANTKKLISVLENISDEKLNKIVGEERNALLGTGFTFEEMIVGLLQHNAYHAGQISLLKK